MFRIVAVRISADGAPDALVGGTHVLGSGRFHAVSYGRSETHLRNPEAHVQVDPGWLLRRSQEQVPRELLRLVAVDARSLFWRCGASRHNDYRICVGPHVGAPPPPWLGEGTIQLDPGSSVDLQMWVLVTQRYRHVMDFHVEHLVARMPTGPVRDPIPMTDPLSPKDDPTQVQVENWINRLGTVDRNVLHQTVLLRNRPDLAKAVGAATGVKDVTTKWSNLARKLAEFVRSNENDNGHPWLCDTVGYPGLREHVLQGAPRHAGSEDMRRFAEYLAGFPRLHWSD